MIPKFKNETLTAVVIIIILILQFILAFTGHRAIQQSVDRVAAQSSQCAPIVSGP